MSSMAPLPVIANVHRCALEWGLGSSQHAANVIHVHTTAGVATTAQVYACLNRNVTAAMWSSVGGSASVTDVNITPLDGVSPTTDFPTGSPAKWTGPGGGQTTPAVATLVKLTTDLRGRSHRGRVYLPFQSEAAEADGALNPATQTAAQAAWTTFLVDIASDATTPMTLVVASYLLGSARNVQTVTVEGMLATQRRRQGRLR